MKVPKILPWLANRAGISEDLALELWRCAARETEMSIADCDSSDLPDLLLSCPICQSQIRITART